MTTAVIVQARMTSKRFPGKVLAPLAGTPVLTRVLERCAMVPFVDTVICAFPAAEESVPIYQLCNSMGIACASGSEDDVLARYYDAATMYGVDTIIRITGDCPFFDPIVAGEVLALLKAENLDYCSNVFPKRTYAKGFDVEAFTYDCLEAAHIESEANPDHPLMKSRALAYNREHVTPWMQKRKGVRRANVQQRVDQSGINLCVDVPGDIERLERFIAKIRLPGLGMEATGTMPAVDKVSQWTKQLMEMIPDGKPPN
jgi:spore coat polysaccharide biosynthesis protein SpsF (cytidylyltransferase family)